jgi:hypothetical protein
MAAVDRIEGAAEEADPHKIPYGKGLKIVARVRGSCSSQSPPHEPENRVAGMIGEHEKQARARKFRAFFSGRVILGSGRRQTQ